MPIFVEDPAHFSKSRLKSDLVAHNVRLPPAKSKKEVYVALHLKHIDRTKGGDFSSDDDEEEEETRVGNEAIKEDNPKDAEEIDPSHMTDDDLKAALLKLGFKAGPILASTRILYEKKLQKLLQPDGHDQCNGAETGTLYSDSENEEEDEEESGGTSTEEEDERTVELSEKAQEQSNQVELQFQNGGFTYPQCFLPSSRLRACASGNRDPGPSRNSGNVLKSPNRSWPRCSQIPVGFTRPSSVDQRAGLGSGVQAGSQSATANGCSPSSIQAFSITEMVEEMESRRSLASSASSEREVNGSNEREHWSRSSGLDSPVLDNSTVRNQSWYRTPTDSPYAEKKKGFAEDEFKDLYPAKTTPTGIYATCRRPIKGAAGRPVQHAYQNTPVSPATLERREVQRRLVPMHVQIFVFVIVMCLLYVIYICVEDDAFSPFVALLDSLTQGFDSEQKFSLQTEAQEAALSDEWE